MHLMELNHKHQLLENNMFYQMSKHTIIRSIKFSTFFLHYLCHILYFYLKFLVHFWLLYYNHNILMFTYYLLPKYMFYFHLHQYYHWKFLHHYQNMIFLFIQIHLILILILFFHLNQV